MSNSASYPNFNVIQLLCHDAGQGWNSTGVEQAIYRTRVHANSIALILSNAGVSFRLYMIEYRVVSVHFMCID